MTAKQGYHALLAHKLIEELEKRNMAGFYCASKEEALKKAVALLPPGCTVSQGGSETIETIGLRDVLKNGDYRFLDPVDTPGAKEKKKIAHEAMNAEYYFMSTNAITLAGELVNVDGIGNRVAALSFGPEHVIVIAGVNKVVVDVEAALQRIKYHTGPLCLMKFKADYADYGDLVKEAEKACSQLVVTRQSVIKDRIKVLLVGQSLGF